MVDVLRYLRAVVSLFGLIFMGAALIVVLWASGGFAVFMMAKLLG